MCNWTSFSLVMQLHIIRTCSATQHHSDLLYNITSFRPVPQHNIIHSCRATQYHSVQLRSTTFIPVGQFNIILFCCITQHHAVLPCNTMRCCAAQHHPVPLFSKTLLSSCSVSSAGKPTQPKRDILLSHLVQRTVRFYFQGRISINTTSKVALWWICYLLTRLNDLAKSPLVFIVRIENLSWKRHAF